MARRIGITERRGLLERFERWVEQKHTQARQSCEEEAKRYVRGLADYVDVEQMATKAAEEIINKLNMLHNMDVTLEVLFEGHYGSTNLTSKSCTLETLHVHLNEDQYAKKENFFNDRLKSFANYDSYLEELRNQLWLIDDREELMALLPEEFIPTLKLGANK